MQNPPPQKQTNKSKPVWSPDPLFLDLLRCAMFKEKAPRNVGDSESAENKPQNQTKEQIDTTGRDELIFSVSF